MEQEGHIGRKHSGIGIASFVMSVSAVILISMGLFILPVPNLLFIVFILLDISALGLGLGAFFQKDRDRTFAVMGVVLSLLVLLALVVLLVPIVEENPLPGNNAAE
tara:strand:- start:337 stop:654 length:318 start_codon:yes stop_codon:yes gene_type:complete